MQTGCLLLVGSTDSFLGALSELEVPAAACGKQMPAVVGIIVVVVISGVIIEAILHNKLGRVCVQEGQCVRFCSQRNHPEVLNVSLLKPLA